MIEIVRRWLRAPASTPGLQADHARIAQQTEQRQRALSAQMKATGKHLLVGYRYTPSHQTDVANTLRKQEQ